MFFTQTFSFLTGLKEKKGKRNTEKKKKRKHSMVLNFGNNNFPK